MTDVFDQNTTPPNTNVSSDPFADKLKTIVNDQGLPKYENTDKALDALAASQAHIKRLEDEAKARESETAKLREEATKAQALEDIVQRLTGNSQKQTKVETPTQTVDVEKVIADQVQNALSQREAALVANTNGQSVRNALVSKFGDVEKARAAVEQKAQELGMTNTQLATLSAQSPKMVLSLFGLQVEQANSNPITPSGTPLNPAKAPEPVQRPAQSLISGVGATDKARKELMAKIREEVYKKFDVTV